MLWNLFPTRKYRARVRGKNKYRKIIELKTMCDVLD
jgi:hypothetical protein